MAGNDAEGKAPTVEEEMSKFKGFSFKDGEPADGKQTAEETATLLANGRTHAENVAAAAKEGKGGKEKAEESAPVELSTEEETDAIQEATDAAGRQLTDKEADDAVAAALEAKQEAAEKPASNKEGKKGKSPTARGDRYENMHNRARTAESRADRAENKNRELEERLARLERGEKPALTADKEAPYNNPENPKPDHTDAEKYPYGELDAKYIADLSRFETIKAIDSREAKGKGAVQTAQEAEAIDAFKQRVADFAEEGAEKFDDFQELVIENLANDTTNPDGWPCSEVLGELLLESEHGHAIAYDLASDIKEARRVYKLPAARQAAWFGVQEAKLESAGSAARDKQGNGEQEDGNGKPAGSKRVLPQPRSGQSRESKAPAPLPNQRKLNGHGGNRVPDGATPDFAAFEANVNAQRQRTH